MRKEEVQIKLGINSSAIKTGLAEVKHGISKFGADIKSYFGDIGKNILGAFAFEKILSKFTELAGKVKELKAQSDSFGLSLELYQGIGRLAKKSAIDPERAYQGIQKLSVVIGNAASGAADAAKKFNKWGIEIEDVDGKLKPTEQILFEISDKLAAMESPALRAAAAHDLLGKKGEALIPIFSKGSKVLKEYRDSLLNISSEDAENVLNLYKTFAQVGKTAELGLAKGLSILQKYSGAAQFGRFFGFLTGGVNNFDSGNITKTLKEIVFGIEQIKASSEGFDIDSKAKAAQESLEKLNEEIEDYLYKQGDEEKKLNKLYSDRKKLQDEFLETQQDSAEYYELEIQLLKKDAEIQKVMDDKKKAAEQREKQALEDRRKVEKEINDAKDKALKSQLIALDKELDKLKTKKSIQEGAVGGTINQLEEYMPSMEEISRFGGEFGRVVDRINFLKEDTKLAILKGNTDYALENKTEIQSLTKRLQDAGLVAVDKSEAIAKATESIDQGIQALTTQQATLKVQLAEPE